MSVLNRHQRESFNGCTTTVEPSTIEPSCLVVPRAYHCHAVHRCTVPDLRRSVIHVAPSEMFENLTNTNLATFWSHRQSPTEESEDDHSSSSSLFHLRKDPSKDVKGWVMNNREVSYTFSPDKVSKDGYELFAERQLVTIFSTPNNCGELEKICMETVQVLSNIWIRDILIIVSDLVFS
uniref:Uncharacterized protein n=1 Tax=Cucumis melo TaxID=3656 RepID=A0A9I9E2P3_CUCME